MHDASLSHRDCYNLFRRKSHSKSMRQWRRSHEAVDIDKADEFLIVHTTFLSSLLKNLACSVCGEKTVNASIGQRNGLCLKVTTKCESCNSVLNDNYTSPKVESANKRSAPFLLNRKIAEAINNIGLGNAALEKICANLCIKSMSSRTYRMHLQSIIQKILVFCRESFNRCSSFCKTSLYK